VADSSDSLVVRAVDYNWGVLGSKCTAVGSYLLPNTIHTTYKLWLVHADGQQQHILFKYATGRPSTYCIPVRKCVATVV